VQASEEQVKQNTEANRGSDSLDVFQIRREFPILSRMLGDKLLVYLDNAATTQKPRSVIEALSSFYSENNANVHRGIHRLSEESTAAYEGTRLRIAAWLGGVEPDGVVFTRGTTEAINLVSSTWGELHIGEGDTILITRMEHHANLIPWIQLAKRKGASLDYVELTDDGRLDMEGAEEALRRSPKLFAFTHMSNVLGTINPAKDLVSLAKQNGTTTLVDGAQAVPHLPVNLAELGADFYAFSAHKMLGPTGVGVLWADPDLLRELPPYQTGGEMIGKVTWDDATWADVPSRFEAGTPNYADVAAFSAAIEFLDDTGMDSIRKHERELVAYTLDAMSSMENITVFGSSDPDIHGGAIAFEVDGVHPHDLAQLLDAEGIAIRAGHHCAQPLTKLLGRTSTARASFYLYNTLEEVDRLLEAIDKAYRYFAG
jgi:cysteine desulfurase/selenocysteine lyase